MQPISSLHLVTFTALAVASTSMLVVDDASADILTARVETRGGGAGGKGMFGERMDEAFHAGSGSLAYGVLIGAEVFFIDGWIEHNQYLSGSDVSGTWTQFMLGMDVVIDMGERKAFDYNEAGKKVGGFSSWFGELGMGFGFGVGTGQQVDPPLDNSEVTDKGFLFEARAAVGYRLTKSLSLGATIPVSLGYYTKSGVGTFSNDVDNHYSSISAAALLSLRIDWNLK